MGIHPLTILTLSYLILDKELNIAELQNKISSELEKIKSV